MGKDTIWYLSALLFMISADTVLYQFKLVPLALVLYLLFICCSVKMVIVGKKRSEQEYYKEFKINKSIDRLSNEIEIMKTNLDLKADKQPKCNIRCGSKPNNEYFKMLIEKEGFNVDNGTTDTEVEKKYRLYTRISGRVIIYQKNNAYQLGARQMFAARR